jgi:hypothetical protein
MRYCLEQAFEASEESGDPVSDIDELRNRLVVVEDQVARLIDDGAATRAMAAMADRDVAEYRQEMRGHTRVLNALRETQIEHGQALVTLTAGQAAIMQHLGIPGQGNDERTGD